VTILHLTTFLQGGAGRAITTLALAQHRDGHRVTVVASKTGPVGYGNYDDYVDRLLAAGVRVRLVDSMFARDPASNVAVLGVLQDLFAPDDTIDVIHTHAAIPSLVALTFAGSRRASPAIVQTMHGWGLRKTAEQTETDVTLLNLVHRVVVPSLQSQEQLSSLGVSPRRVDVVPYGVGDPDTELSSRDRALVDAMEKARRAGRLVVAAVGTIGDRKNQRLLVEALATTDAPSDVFCVFVGDGQTTELAAAIGQTGLSDKCRVHGYSAAARQIAAAADVFVLASRNEGQPLSVLEAFADGVLVAVSDSPELAELVDDGVTGCLFHVDDAASLARVLSKFAAMPAPAASAMRGRARQVYSATFTEGAMVARYGGVYERVRAGVAERVPRLQTRPLL
jgi:glycosyltransferase involved in cell wall biosynthesis